MLTPGVMASQTSDLDYGDVVSLTTSAGYLGAHAKLKTYDSWWRRQYLKIDTSCQRALQCGDQLGAYKVVGSRARSAAGRLQRAASAAHMRVARRSEGTPTREARRHGARVQRPGLPGSAAEPAIRRGQVLRRRHGRDNVGVIYAGMFGYAHQVTPPAASTTATASR
jgi:hypothetical protein